MSTIDSKSIINKIIANDGYFESDLRVYMIVEYINAYGGIAYGVTWVNESPERRTRYLEETEHVNRPRVIWHSESK